MQIEDELRRALKPIDPGPDFTARVLAAVTADRPANASGDQTGEARRGVDGRGPRRAPVWAWAALAASLVGAVVGARWVEERRETARALEARAALIQALRVTSAKLSVAREVVVDR
jgi:hypothetical protein